MTQSDFVHDKELNVIFFGSPDFAVPTLRALTRLPGLKVQAVVTKPDREAGRGRSLQMTAVKSAALKLGLPCFQPQRLRNQEDSFLQAIAPYGPFDVGIVIAYGLILPKRILDLPLHGCLNIHASLLPRWRGAAPIQRSIMAGDTVSGVTIMQMEEGLDTGPTYAAESVPIHPTTTAGELHDVLAELGAATLSKHLASIVGKKLAPIAQPDIGASYASKIESAEGAIDWGSSALAIVHKIHGLSPFPGAFTNFRNDRMKILRARAIAASSINFPPGQVQYFNEARLEISCGAGAIMIEELQRAGGKPMAVADFLRGAKLVIGERLGNS